MFKRLKRLTAIAGVGALAFAVAPTAAQAAAPGWTHTVGVKTGDTAHHGVIHGPDGANYLCAADGAAYSASAVIARVSWPSRRTRRRRPPA